MSIQLNFDALNPWVTVFHVGGQSYGGTADNIREFTTDYRIEEFACKFPTARTIMELGSFEGGHTLALARLPGVSKVVGMEGRARNIEKARFIHSLLGHASTEFVECDLETVQLSDRYDAVFCSGILYHLQQPWRLIQQISGVTNSLYLSTHYASHELRHVEHEGYLGLWYSENIEDSLAGLSSRSFWLSAADLFRVLREAGFVRIEITSNEPGNPSGPIIGIAARK